MNTFSFSEIDELHRQTPAVTLWHTFNRCQESALTGGIAYRSRTQRLVQTRRIRNIREGVRINTALWQAACRILES
jgi:hypothetical protein